MPLENHAAHRIVEWRLARRVWQVPVISGVPLHLCASPARPGCRMVGRFDLIHGVPSTGCRTDIRQVFSFGRVNISRPRWRVAGWRRVHWCWKSSRYVSSELFYLPVVAEVTIQADSIYCGRFMLSPSRSSTGGWGDRPKVIVRASFDLPVLNLRGPLSLSHGLPPPPLSSPVLGVYCAPGSTAGFPSALRLPRVRVYSLLTPTSAKLPD